MTLQTSSGARGKSSSELTIPQFGTLNCRHLQEEQEYQGQLIPLSPETRAEIAEALGFSAKFEFPALRSAYLDLFEGQGHAVVEIERNARPADVSVRYSRDRWILQDVIGKTIDRTPALIKSDYHARQIGPEINASICRLLGITPQASEFCYLRINFKENSGAIIFPREKAHLLPENHTGSFTVCKPNAAALPAEPDNLENQPENKEEAAMSNQETPWIVDRAGTDSENDQTVDAKSPETPADTAAESGSKAEPAAESFFQHKIEPAPAPTPAQATRPAANRQESKREFERVRDEKPGLRRETNEIQPKYATYSKSEVDALLKQQAETLLAALSSKMGQQQRTFQESVSEQEKAFNKLYDKFTGQFESAKNKLESTTKTAQDKTAEQLDTFKKTLSKELESHRTQINKTVMPVTKALEERPAKAPKETPKVVPQVVVKGAPAKPSKLLAATLIAASLSLIISVANFLTLNDLHLAVANLSKGDQATNK